MRFALLLPCSILIAGCQVMHWSDRELQAARTQVMQLVGTNWRAQAIGESVLSEAIESTVHVDPGARISGRGGCNLYVTELVVESRSIRFGEILTADMSCKPQQLEQEQRFFQALTATRGIRFADDRLWFLNESGDAILKLARLPVLALSQ